MINLISHELALWEANDFRSQRYCEQAIIASKQILERVPGYIFITVPIDVKHMGNFEPRIDQDSSCRFGRKLLESGEVLLKDS